MTNRNVLCSTLLVVLAFNSVWAQTSSTTLLGTVVDASGAPTPGAAVSATHVATRQARSTTTNDQGYYVLPALDVGEYTVSVKLAFGEPGEVKIRTRLR